MINNIKNLSVYKSEQNKKIQWTDIVQEVSKINKLSPDIRSFIVKRDTDLPGNYSLRTGLYFCELSRDLHSDILVDSQGNKEYIYRISNIIHYSSTIKEMLEYLQGVSLGLSSIQYDKGVVANDYSPKS